MLPSPAQSCAARAGTWGLPSASTRQRDERNATRKYGGSCNPNGKLDLHGTSSACGAAPAAFDAGRYSTADHVVLHREARPVRAGAARQLWDIRSSRVVGARIIQ